MVFFWGWLREIWSECDKTYNSVICEMSAFRKWIVCLVTFGGLNMGVNTLYLYLHSRPDAMTGEPGVSEL